MSSTPRAVHYVNQFFAGIGGEDSAGAEPAIRPEPVGPGRKLQQLLGDDVEIVATVWCGDDLAATDPAAIDGVLALIRSVEPDLVVAGPAFGSGRYGVACGRVAAAAAAAGIAAFAVMHEDNPGVEEAGTTPVIGSGATAREMGKSLETVAAAVRALAAGEALTTAHGRLGRPPRRNTFAERNAAERAVDLALARLGGDTTATEVPVPRFDAVTPAAPVADPASVVVAFVTEGGLVPNGNPDKLESARATRWLRYALDGVDTLEPGEWGSVHGGFSTVWANEDPHRILPLDIARELEQEGRIGGLHPAYLVTTGNGTSVGNAKRFGVEWAADLRRSEVRAAVFTAT